MGVGLLGRTGSRRVRGVEVMIGNAETNAGKAVRSKDGTSRLCEVNYRGLLRHGT